MAPLLNGTRPQMVDPDSRVVGRNSPRYGWDVEYSAHGKMGWRRIYAPDEQDAKDMVSRSYCCPVIFFSVKAAK